MANTHSLDLEMTSNQNAYRTDANNLNGVLDVTGDFTIECWIKLESSPTIEVGYVMVSKYEFAAQKRSYAFLYQNLSNVYKLSLAISSDGTANESLQINYTLNTGTWYHVAAVYTVSTKVYECFVNGSSIGTANGTMTSIYNGTAAFRIGDWNGGATSPFDGLIDEVRLWSVARTQAEISANYQTELAGNETGLNGYWKFNNTYNDSTSNGNNLTAVNSPVFSTDVPTWTSTTTSIKSLLGLGIIPFPQ